MRTWHKQFWVWAACALCAVPTYAQAPDLDNLDIVLRSIHNGPIARVNGKDIPKSEFEELYRGRVVGEEQMRGTKLGEADRIRLGVYCLGQVIQSEILRQEADKRNITVSDAHAEKVLEATLDQLRRARPDRDLSTDDVLEISGTDRATALAEVKKGLRIEKAREEIAVDRGVKIGDADVMQRFNEQPDRFKRPESIHMKQIFFKAPAGGSDAIKAQRDAARKKAEACALRLQQGITFEGLARKESEGPQQLRDSGGDMGPMPVNQIPPPLVQAASQLEPGEVSGVVETSFGFHIIKLVEVLDAEPVDMDRAKKTIRAELMAEKSEAAVRKYVQEVMENGAYEVQDFLDIERQLRYRPDLVEELSGEIAPSGS